MSKRKSPFDEAVQDFMVITPLHKVEREKDRPWLSDQTLAYLTKKGLLKEETGQGTIKMGREWEVLGKVGTRAGRYIKLKEQPAAPEAKKD
jgi:hypothetical protein